ncbi:hypothetical protein OIO90_004438 [Microbotryomycetes sp. JL221]|nr:hypothetical protein OIO90_004438 [Microbotryomycetes sp. JL221]
MSCMTQTQAFTPWSSSSATSSSMMTFCKCTCFQNSTIIPLYRPKDPLHPCLTCTKQFCLDQKLQTCVGAHRGQDDPDTGTGQEGDVEARCFQRDSPKSHFLVILFILVTTTLLILAGLKRVGIDVQTLLATGGIRAVMAELAQVTRNLVSGASRSSSSRQHTYMGMSSG